MSAHTYRKKPVIVEAFLMTEGRFHSNADWPEWMHEAWNLEDDEQGSLIRDADGGISIFTLEGPHKVGVGDWIIKGVAGELYPCKPDIFDRTYEKVE